MIRQVVILGTGKMARDVGGFLLGQGLEVVWLTRDGRRLEGMQREIGKICRRLTRSAPVGATLPACRCAIIDDPGMATASLVLETVNENVSDKRRAIAAVESLFDEETLLLSNSSSIPPSTLHPRCQGMHFFYPVALTRFVEIVFQGSASGAVRRRVTRLAEELGLGFVEEDENGAFAVNRLLLPLQAEALRAVEEGVPLLEVDRLTVSEITPVGQLSLMDEIGFDTLAAALANYRAAMTGEEAAWYDGLAGALEQLLAMGKLGKKTRDGLFSGGPLPWAERVPTPESLIALGRRLRLSLLNSCLARVDTRDMTREALDRALGAVFQAEQPLADVLTAAGDRGAARELALLYERTGIGYFRPSLGWTE